MHIHEQRRLDVSSGSCEKRTFALVFLTINHKENVRKKKKISFEYFILNLVIE
jgi:hypothetical protein